MPTFHQPNYVDGNRIPLDLFVRVSAADTRHFDVVDDAGSLIARDVPNLNTARLLAAAPLLLDRFYEMRTTIAAWVETGRISSLANPGRDDFVRWLDDLSTV